MPARVQVAHHRLELLHLLAAPAAGGVLVVRREEPDRVVAPVVAQAAVDQVPVVDELVHRHQLDRRHAQPLQVLEDRRVAERRVGAADLLGHARVGHREALHVGLVDRGLVVRPARRAVVLPVEERVHDDRVGHVRARVGRAHAVRLAGLIGQHGQVPVDPALDRARVWVEQQLVGVAAQPARRIPWAVHPVAVALPGPDARQVGVPDAARRARSARSGSRRPRRRSGTARRPRRRPRRRRSWCRRRRRRRRAGWAFRARSPRARGRFPGAAFPNPPRRSAAPRGGADLLDHPGVAVGVAEAQERGVVAARGVGPRLAPARAEVEDLARLDPPRQTARLGRPRCRSRSGASPRRTPAACP